MFNVSVDNFWNEIDEGVHQRDEVLSNYQVLLDQYVGKGMNLLAGQSDWPDNYSYQYCTYMVPKIVLDNPRVSITTRRQVSESMVMQLQEMLMGAVESGQLDPMSAQKMYAQATQPNTTALAIEHGLNKWVRDSNYHSTLDRVCYDFLQAYGITLTTLGVMPGHDPRDPDSLRWPLSKRIAPRRFVQDSLALHHTESRWQAHQSIEDKADLIARAKANPESGWIMDALQALPETTGREELDSESTSYTANLQRKEVVLYEAWVGEYTEDGWPGPDEGYNGGLFTIAGTQGHQGEEQGKGAYIRKPRPFYGPRWGPYTQWGVYINPDNPYPLSPLLATFTQQAELNAHAKAMSRSASQYKRIVLVSDRNPKLAQDIAESPDMFVVTVDDEQFDKDQVVVIEIGGITDQQLRHYEVFTNRLEELLGLTQTQKGNIDPRATATVESIAQSSSELRISYLKNKFRQSVRQDLMSKVFYFVNDDRIQFGLGAEAGEALGMLRPEFFGGPSEDGDHISIEDLELEIDAYSMERTDEALLQKRMMEAFQLIMAAAPMMIQQPWIDWREMVRKIGDALNLPDLVDIIKFDMIQQMSQMAMQQGMGQPQQMSADGLKRSQSGSSQPSTSQAREQGQQSQLARSA